MYINFVSVPDSDYVELFLRWFYVIFVTNISENCITQKVDCQILEHLEHDLWVHFVVTSAI